MNQTNKVMQIEYIDMIKLTNKQRFILNNLMILVAVLVGITFLVACINMPVNQSTNEMARIVFSIIVIIAPLAFFASVVVDDYKLNNKYGFKHYWFDTLAIYPRHEGITQTVVFKKHTS